MNTDCGEPEVNATGADAVPFPTDVIARSLTYCVVPVIKPLVIVTGLVVVPELVHVPLSIWYS